MIWVWKTSLQELNQWMQNSLVQHLGIEFSEIGENFLSAKMPVEARTMQPMQILHGGATVALVETTANAAANLCIDFSRFLCVGLELNVNHIKTVRSGNVEATARPIHLGKATQVWDVQVRNEEKEITAVGRLTVFVLERKKPAENRQA